MAIPPSTLHHPYHEQRRGRAARPLARRCYPGPEPCDDLLQVAQTGRVKAVDRFDPSTGTRFSSLDQLATARTARPTITLDAGSEHVH